MQMGERYDEHQNRRSSLQSYAYLVIVVPVQNRQRIRESSILVHKLVLVSRQKHGQNQLHLQFGRLHPCTRVPTSSPCEERIGSSWDRVRSQPSTGVVLVWLRVVLRVQMNVSHGIHEEITTSDHPVTNFYLSTKIPSKGGIGNANSLRLLNAGVEDREFIFPCRDRNSFEFLVERCRVVCVIKVRGNQVMDLLLTSLSPL